MTPWLVLLAQATDPAQQGQGPPAWTNYVQYVLLGLAAVLFIRALGKPRRDQQRALSGLKKNDKVVTSGGILGVVVAIKENEDEVTLKVDDTSNTRIRVLKSSITQITSGDPAGEAKPQ